MSELPLFLFRGKQRDRAKDRVELRREAGDRREGPLRALDPNRAVRERGRTVGGWPEWWSNGKA